MITEIIARVRRRDGFVLEKVIPKREMYLHFADIPPIRAYKRIEEVDSDISKIIQRDFVAIKETIYIDYQEQ